MNETADDGWKEWKMKEIRIKAWKAEQIKQDARRYRFYAMAETSVDGGDGTKLVLDGNDFASVWILECDKATEKAVRILVACETVTDGGFGNLRSFGAWVPKSAFESVVEVGDYRNDADRKLEKIAQNA